MNFIIKTLDKLLDEYDDDFTALMGAEAIQILLNEVDLDKELQQIKEEFGEIPKKLKLLNCVGGGSSAMGFWNEFMDTHAEFIGIEAGGPKNSNLFLQV